MFWGGDLELEKSYDLISSNQEGLEWTKDQRNRKESRNRFTQMANWVSTEDIHTSLRSHKNVSRPFFFNFLKIPTYMQEWEHIKWTYKFSTGSWQAGTISAHPYDNPMRQVFLEAKVKEVKWCVQSYAAGKWQSRSDLQSVWFQSYAVRNIQKGKGGQHIKQSKTALFVLFCFVWRWDHSSFPYKYLLNYC